MPTGRVLLQFAAIALLTAGVCHPTRAQTNTNQALPELELSRESFPAERSYSFAQVIQATTGHRVLPLDTNQVSHRALLDRLMQAAAVAGERARKAGLSAVRANEAGNQIEAFVKTALKDAGLNARTPVTTAGNAQVVGYPDVEILGDTPCYLELKTYSPTTANTTQRSFYFSPSEKPKVTRDALHLLLAYELKRTERDGQAVFLPVAWKLITLEGLRVDLKIEFNQSNRGLYGPGNAGAELGQGSLK